MTNGSKDVQVSNISWKTLSGKFTTYHGQVIIAGNLYQAGGQVALHAKIQYSQKNDEDACEFRT
eukprot:13107295-Ditylum_brightwellii.AAC.1